MKNSLVVKSALLVSISIALLGCTAQPTVTYTQKLKKMLGDEFRDYEPISYPTNNFGLATTYTPDSDNNLVSDKDILCSTWRCLGLQSYKEIPEALPDQLHLIVNGKSFADTGTGGPVSLTDEESNSALLKAVLPQVKSVLKLGASLDSKSITKSELRFGQAVRRTLSKPEFIAYIRDDSSTNPTKNELRKKFSQGALAVVVGDVVIDTMKTTITTDSKTTPEFEAALGSLPSKVFSDANLSIKVTRASKGTYVLETTAPVIALRLVKKQPAAGGLGVKDSWADWPVTQSADPTLPKN